MAASYLKDVASSGLASLPHKDAAALLDHWGPMLIAVMLAVTILALAGRGKVLSRRLALLCSVLALCAIACMGLIGISRLAAPAMPKGYGPTFSLSYFRQRLPGLSDALYDGAWATDVVLPQLEQARSEYPGQVKLVDKYIAAWYFWHHDPQRGEAALWRLGMQADLARRYEADQRWEVLEKVAQGEYLTAASESLPSGRVEAMKALARRANRPEEAQTARRFLLEAFKQSGRLEVEEQDRLWRQVSGGVGQEISWTEYYRCLQQLSMQAQTSEALGRLLFEMRKVEQLHPEVQPGQQETQPPTRG